MPRAAQSFIPPTHDTVLGDGGTHQRCVDPTAVPQENDLLAKLLRWLQLQDVTWCGTPAELAFVLEVAADELVKLVESNSAALEHLGVRVSLARDPCGLRRITVSRTEISQPEGKCEPIQECEPTTVATAGLDHRLPEKTPGNIDSTIAQDSAPLMSSVLFQTDSGANWRLRVTSLVTTTFVLIAAFLFFHGSGRIPFRFTHVGNLLSSVAKRASPNSSPVPQNSVGARAPETDGAADGDLMSFSALLGAARSGNLEAQHLVGLKYLHGDGVEANSATAADWLHRAALRGHPGAQYELANNYLSGGGRPADPRAAYTWFVIAYANGDARGQDGFRAIAKQLSLSDIAQIRFNVGEMYMRGIGVQPDPVAAYVWYRLAEAAGDRGAKGAEAALAANMTDDEISAAGSRAAEWLKNHRMAK